MHKLLSLVIIGAIAAVGFSFVRQNLGSVPTAFIPANITIENTEIQDKPSTNKTNLPLQIPNGFVMSVYARDLDAPRDLELDSKGTVIVSAMAEGKVYALKDNENIIVAQNLTRPHGLAFHTNKLYVAEGDKVSVFDYDSNSNSATNKRKLLDLPNGGNHVTRSILIHENKIYISIGSSCNVCNENDSRRAVIMTANLDGSDFKQYATGLRNSVFMAVNPATQEVWATENGRDMIGDDIPPDEINIVKEGHFGWPHCYGKQVHDDSFDKAKSVNCGTTLPSRVDLQAHSAALGLAFWKEHLLVAFHGSWNRSTPTGYKVVIIDPATNTVKDWLTGWQNGGVPLGRPVDILVKNGGEIYISDDKAGVVYKLTSS
jgi:glucose/arabinose dehydrogenase